MENQLEKQLLEEEILIAKKKFRGAALLLEAKTPLHITTSKLTVDHKHNNLQLNALHKLFIRNRRPNQLFIIFRAQTISLKHLISDIEHLAKYLQTAISDEIGQQHTRELDIRVAGVVFPDSGATPKMLFQKLDTALYHANASGFRAINIWQHNLNRSKLKLQKLVVIRMNVYATLAKLTIFWKHLSLGTTYITCTGRTDGVGSQAFGVIATMLYARNKGLTYVHTPFKKIEHNTNEMDNWVDNWERFLNIGMSEILVDDITYDYTIDAPPLRLHLLSKRFRSTVLLRVLHGLGYFQREMGEGLERLRSDLRTRYGKGSPKPATPYKIGTIDIAVHIRRSDILAFPDRYLTTQHFINIMQKLDAVLAGQASYRLHVFSQGVEDDFPEFRFKQTDAAHIKSKPLSNSCKGIQFYLDVDPFFSFHCMVAADILVTSISAFSYVAGLLSNNIIVSTGFFEPLPKRWLTHDGSYDLVQTLAKQPEFKTSKILAG